jgi:hypothetical protein
MPLALDIPSLNAAAAAVALALAVAMLAVRATQRTEPGFGLWVAGACACSGALGLISLQGRAPAILTVVAANGLIAAYAALTTAGLERFLERRPRWALHATGLALVVAGSALLTFVWPAVPARIALVCFALAGWLGASAALVVRRARRELGAPNRFLPAALGAFALWNLARATYLRSSRAAAAPLPANDPVQALFFVALPALVAAVAVGLTALDLQRVDHRLRASAEELGLLRGIVPICAGCKRIRDGHAWTPVEQWVAERSDAEFSHGLCPACVTRLYPDAPSPLRPP